MIIEKIASASKKCLSNYQEHLVLDKRLWMCSKTFDDSKIN